MLLFSVVVDLLRSKRKSFLIFHATIIYLFLIIIIIKVGELPYILKTDSTEQEIEIKFDDSVIKGQKSPSKSAKSSKRNVKQKTEVFYDMDTRDEVLEKEQSGGADYQMLKAARKLKRQWMHFEPNKLLEAAKKVGTKAAVGTSHAAKKASEGAKDAVQKFSTATQNAATSTSTALQSAAEPLRRVVKSDGTVTHVPARSKSPVRKGRLGASSSHNMDASYNSNSGALNDDSARLDMEESARKEAIGRSKREAAEQRAAAAQSTTTSARGRSPRRPESATNTPSKAGIGAESDDDDDPQMREFEEAARREAIERSRREAAEQRAAAKAKAHNTTTSHEDHEDAARRAAVERSRREAEEARAAARAKNNKSPPPPKITKTLEELAREQDEEARKAAIARSREEAARNRSQSPMRR